MALAQSRNALVIGNSAYESAPRLRTPATDAAIIAETLRAAGYEVTELRDVRQANIGQAMRDFLDKAAAGGSDGAAFFYFSGYGAQAEGENFLVPVDAVISNDGEVAKEAFHLDDLLDELKDIPLAARIVVLDASRDHKFGSAGSRPVAKGLAMGDTIPGMLLAFAAAPGALAIDGDGDYSLFTGALVTMLRQPGFDMEQIFKATRVQVNQTTRGAQTPWMVSALNLDMRLFAATDAAPAPRSRPRGRAHLNQGDAAHALARRGLQGRGRRRHARSLSMVCRAPSELPFGRGDRDILETRREAVLWRRTLAQNTTRAYWNYLKRYPDGAHAGEAQAQLDALSASRTPPVTYVPAPEPLPPDCYDEAVGLVEIVPEGFDAPPSVFDVLGAFGPRDGRNRDRDGDRKKTGIVRGTPTPGITRVTPGVRDGKKPGVNLPGGRRSTPPVSGRPPIPCGVVRPTTPDTPGGTRRGGVALSPSGSPTIPRGPAATGRPTTPGLSRDPAARQRPAPRLDRVFRSLLPVLLRDQAAPHRARRPDRDVQRLRAPCLFQGARRRRGVAPVPTTPGATRPALPPIPGTARPTTPGPVPPTAGQRPGLPPTPTPSITRPTAPPTGRPTAPPTTRPRGASGGAAAAPAGLHDGQRKAGLPLINAAMVFMNFRDKDAHQTLGVCLPEGTHTKTVVENFLAFARQHGDDRKYNPSFLIYWSLLEKYPCKS